MIDSGESPPHDSSLSPERARSLKWRQAATVVLLLAGYAAYYFCRADLAVATPLLIEELESHGVSSADALVRIGGISSAGLLAYALGKMLLGGLGDYWGGRPSFLLGLGGATLFTLLFAAGGTLPVFTIAWVGNRLTQSIGWAGLLKVCSRWFDFSSYGMIVGVLSISYLIGDAVARPLMGMLIEHGYNWRALFYFGAATTAVLFAANFFLLRESRTESGFPEAKPNPINLFAGAAARPASVGAVLRPLLLSRAFGLVCLLSFGCTVVRETFNNWTPEYLDKYVGYSAGGAGTRSAIFPLVGIASLVLTGWLSDKLGTHGRPIVLFLGLLATAVALGFLSVAPAGLAHSVVPLVLIGAVAFCLLGPYSYLGGAFALDFGGKQAGAISSGLIDGVGYIGGTIAGFVVARIAVKWGWQGVFMTLAVVSVASAIAAGFLYVEQRRLAGRGVT